MRIEVPKEEDFEKINEIAKQVHELHVEWRPDIFVSVDNVIEKERFEELIKEEKIYIAKMADEIVGYMTINIKEKNVHGMHYRRVLEVDAICVDEDYRSHGIGAALMEYANDIGAEQDCTDLYLTVNEENIHAIKFYEKIGMKVKNISYSMKIQKE